MQYYFKAPSLGLLFCLANAGMVAVFPFLLLTLQLMQQIVSFPSGDVKYVYDDSSLGSIGSLCNNREYLIITDTHLAEIYPILTEQKNTIILPAGEASKSIQTISFIAGELVRYEITRKHVLVGVGGGVVTDITGFIANVYMRGVAFGFIPTTLLGMVDAAIGGKNGVNLGMNKNILGTITQPSFLLFDITLLNTLPIEEWSNGFAEIIKYACIFDKELLEELAIHDITYYRADTFALQSVIERCVNWKNKTVIEDEHEKGNRKLLNFGHTAGHAIENLYNLPHGHAVAIGMVIAATLSEQITGYPAESTAQLKAILERYQLPTSHKINVADAMAILKMDKKRHDEQIDFVLLEHPGAAIIRSLPFETIEKAITLCAQ